MKLKILLGLIALFTFTQVSLAQKIKLKKGKVLLDGKEILKYEREDFGVYQIHFYSLDSDDEILFFKRNDNETSSYFDDDYTQIKFLGFKKSLEIKQKKSWKKYLLWLIKKKVLDKNGKLNEDKADDLIENYDENITGRTIRY
ncbi:hypothetical protein [Tenacibaculum singaporense]|uniref:Uncharacterized protein n=1 Tax=Tenacibaculum singaporense TaxID=2358479 RepID=A0A3Q8RQX0_9FLAO|nr:hypothetical protein [Tenacibaculum singaporense]AZJ34742.1 hypothetical protein D6T69_04065 [Tenacibaculum singaporense]